MNLGKASIKRPLRKYKNSCRFSGILSIAVVVDSAADLLHAGSFPGNKHHNPLHLKSLQVKTMKNCNNMAAY